MKIQQNVPEALWKARGAVGKRGEQEKLQRHCRWYQEGPRFWAAPATCPPHPSPPQVPRPSHVQTQDAQGDMKELEPPGLTALPPLLLPGAGRCPRRAASPGFQTGQGVCGHLDPGPGAPRRSRSGGAGLAQGEFGKSILWLARPEPSGSTFLFFFFF